MKKYSKKFGIMFLMSLILVLGFCVNAFATTDTGIVGTNDGGVVGTANLNNTVENSAKVGDKLTAPEVGWKRYDDRDSRIIYKTNGSGLWSPTSLGNESGSYKSTRRYYSNGTDLNGTGTITFKFYGTKLRMISVWDSKCVSSIVKIDGIVVDSSSLSNNIPATSELWQTLVHDISGLETKVHTVEIYNTKLTAHDVALDFDAIDIDDTGYLIPYDESITLDKSTMDLTEGDSEELTATTTPAEVGVTWTSSDSSVATIEVDPTNGKIIKVTALKEGTCTITATTADGNNLSASCTVNVTKNDTTEPTTPPDNSDNKTGATLIINLTDGETKVFDISASETDKFKEWYNTKTEYENQLTYEFDKTVDPSISVEEDVVHDQITSYEIRKY